MSVFDDCFAMGLGTARFPISGPNDADGIEKSVGIVLKALDLGVNYIDTSHIYSGGMAQTVLRQAFARTGRPYAVTLKAQYGVDKTADDARRRAEKGLESMGINRAAFFVSWSVKSYAEFEEIMKKGGIYDGALRMKEEKLIDHICFSSHAPIAETIRIIESGAFEGVTISYSLLNGIAMQPVLDAAQANNVGVAVMNPLGGGIVPQNKEFFSFAQNGSENAVQVALRYIAAHSAVQIVISGCSSEAELEENVSALSMNNYEDDCVRIRRVNKRILGLSGFCTGCRYCEPCPKGVPVSDIMQGRNTLMFSPPADYKRTEPELLGNISLFRKLYFDFQLELTDMTNACVHCGQCEKKCTQSLNIRNAIDGVYDRAKITNYTPEMAKERLRSLVAEKQYRKVGFYPSGGYADYVLKLYRRFFGEPEWEVLMFNGNPKAWGTISGGFTVHSPEEIGSLSPDAIVVNSYVYRDAIYEDLRQYEKQGTDILLLHKDEDIPWVW
ncbi:aldo/keto reductase [Synergistales bacterium]|nr:aldo/keto reductase [Synergistales bacterium]